MSFVRWRGGFWRSFFSATVGHPECFARSVAFEAHCHDGLQDPSPAGDIVPWDAFERRDPVWKVVREVQALLVDRVDPKFVVGAP